MTGLLMASESVAKADDAAAPPVRRLAWDPRVDIAVTSSASIWLIASELLKANLVPEKCRWCYRLPDGSDALNSVDGTLRRKLKWENTNAAGAASSVLGFVLLPLGALGMTAGAAANDHALSGFPVDAVVMTEATVIAADVNQLVKFAFARERPFVHYLPRAPDGVRALTESPSDDNLSFYSGHTNLAFATASSSGTVALMRGYRLAPLVLGVGLLSAFGVGYLRIAADKHYFSDVMVGAVLGSLLGAGIPLLFHSPRSGSDTAAPQASGQALSAIPMPSTPFMIDGRW